MAQAQRGLQDVLAHQESEQRETALRALLMQPLLSSASPHFALVRQHADYLRDWLQRETGWALQVGGNCARL
jgi:hypothetical protein